MLAANRMVICFFVAVALLLSRAGLALAADAQGKAVVFGTPTANLRAGASVEQAIKLTLKEGDPVTVEKLEGEWYLVTAADGQKGYIHKNLLKLAPGEGAPSATPPAAPPTEKAGGAVPATPLSVVAPPAVKPAKSEKAPAPAVAPPVRVKAPEGQAPSLLQILEAHEAEVKIGLLIAAVAFALGWIGGGLYAVRRERRSRRRLRL